MLLLYSAPGAAPDPETPEGQANRKAWLSLTDEMDAAGILLGGDALQPHTTATTLRVRDGETLLTDGPFAETKETLAGFYLLDVADLDAATAWAARMPIAPYGSVELRPVLEIARP
ncbi:MAG TPA: YciI family protein [Solirubrobacteraceae bacterium]|jgi:hypothetical protein